MATVRLDGMLKEFGAPRSFENDEPTVGRLLDVIEERYPRLRYRIRDETGRRRGNVRLFVNGTDIEDLSGLETPLMRKDEVDILHSIQGG
ncbi:MAG: MoaD/ThiS family protein [Thermoplasmata archaeon]